VSLIALPEFSYAELIVSNGKRPENSGKSDISAERADVVEAVARNCPPFFLRINGDPPGVLTVRHK